ncbi:MAG TPA: sigma-54 dependent transcriptional regulator [Candidatus Acidoferrum sp.]|nr:sigma-54 dependent transcriptional regulator [Candidatus Acidoferrum sp.]
MGRILIVEDEPVLRDELRRLFARKGHDVAVAGSVREAESHLGGRDGDGAVELVLADLRLPGAPGTELIGRARSVPVLIMTSYATVKSAVEAMRMGAVDYIAKPIDHDELVMIVDRILERERQRRQSGPQAREAGRAAPAMDGIVGGCAAMREVFERIRKVAPTSSTVLILGESGTGKELVARALHAHSPRSEAPIVTVNCAAVPASLIESELFGHEKGAFTGATSTHAGLIEAAEGGTLFLDEIGELPLTVQAQLLRVLQNGEVRRVGSTKVRRVDVRLVAATHRDLARMIQEGAFRSDLYFRLRVVDVIVPALRERGEDIEELALFLLERIAGRLGRPRRSMSPEALEAIRAYAWPGNVRELENAIERAVILSDAETILPAHLGLPAATPALSPSVPPGEEEDLSLVAYFRRFVLTHQDHMNESDLAAKLGISRKALWERRLKLALPRPRSGGG